MFRFNLKKPTLSGLVDSDSEQESYLEATSTSITSPDTTIEEIAPPVQTKKSAKMPAIRSSKTKAPARGGAKTKRPALADKTNRKPDVSESEEIEESELVEYSEAHAVNSGDELDETAETVVSVKPKKAAVTKPKASNKRPRTKKEAPAVEAEAENDAEAPPPKKRGRKAVAVEAEAESETEAPPKKRGRKAAVAEAEVESHAEAAHPKKRGRKKKAESEPVVEIPETQPEIQESSVMQIDSEGDEYTVLESAPVKQQIRLPRASSSDPPQRKVSRRVEPPYVPPSRQGSVSRKRAGSMSDTERNDPMLRRKLGDMSRKLENLDTKYTTLREIGVKEAEQNFEELRKQSEAKTKAANEYIASLKADLAAQNNLGRESKQLRKQLGAQEDEITQLKAKISQMNTSLSEAQAESKTLSMKLAESQAENKTLSTKLAANRTAAASVETVNMTSAKTPGSAMKSNGGIRMIGSAEAAQAAQTAQLKEDLYSDLCGLIIRGVKREAEEDVYDCIQTGRNGTLHFKLAITNEKSAESYEDTQCIYIPQLDPSRDKALIDILPDYLVDEITFPRPHASKFYTRVMKALNDKVVE